MSESTVAIELSSGTRKCCDCARDRSLADFTIGHYRCRECRVVAYKANKNGERDRAIAYARVYGRTPIKAARDAAWRLANKPAIAAMGKKYRDRESERLSVQYADRYRKNRISRLVKSARDRAEERGMAFDLTAADIVVPELCPVLGIRLVWREAGGSRGFPRDNSPSIDRFDNALGYTRDNVRIISWRANAIKGDATREEIELVAAYMRGSGK